MYFKRQTRNLPRNSGGRLKTHYSELKTSLVPQEAGSKLKAQSSKFRTHYSKLITQNSELKTLFIIHYIKFIQNPKHQR